VCTAQSAQSEGSGSTLQQTSGAANQSNGQAAPNASPLPAGTTLQAELTKPVDARKSNPGDRVLAKVTHGVKVNGSVVIPKGSRLVGHVTEVKARSKDQATSYVGIAFDRAVSKNGTEMSLALGIQAIGRSMPPGKANWRVAPPLARPADYGEGWDQLRRAPPAMLAPVRAP
jgi:type IV secretory pathway VirB10-like protein